MFKHFLSAALVFLCLGAKAQTVSVVKIDAVEKLLHMDNDTTYVINFWATWCHPCVHELPGYVKLDSMYKGKKVKLVLISMDFVKEAHTKVEPFLAHKKMNQTVWLLDEPDYNSWIDKVEPSWGGSLPATLIINNKAGKRIFREEELGFETLNTLVKPIVTN